MRKWICNHIIRSPRIAFKAFQYLKSINILQKTNKVSIMTIMSIMMLFITPKCIIDFSLGFWDVAEILREKLFESYLVL